MHNSYLEELFSIPFIKSYYLDFIEKKLDAYLREENLKRINLYQLDIEKCLRLSVKLSDAKIIEFFEDKKKPFNYKELEMIRL